MLVNSVRFFFLFFAMSMVSFASEKPADVAYEFLNEYYAVKDILKVKNYLHQDLIDMLNTDNRRSKEIQESTDYALRLWSEYNFVFKEENRSNESVFITFGLDGVFDNKEVSTKINVEMKEYNGSWKVYGF